MDVLFTGVCCNHGSARPLEQLHAAQLASAAGGGKCRVDSASTPMYCNATDGTDTGAMFCFYDPNNAQVDLPQPG
jgi:hypothetical protein